MGNPVSRSARWRPSRLHRWAVLSAAGHLVALLVLVPALEPEPEVETRVVVDVDLVDREPEIKRSVQRPAPQVAQSRGDRRRRQAARKRRKRPSRVAPPASRQPEPEELPDLLLMRPPEPTQEDEAPPPPDERRFASFLSRAPRPVPASRERLASMEVTRYADGGRVLRSTGGEPNREAMGLLDLAAGKLGHRSGSQACNPYRGWRGLGQRELILMVDTSGSVVRSRRAPASLVCAAGAALAALKRGFSVTVINFSSITQRYGPTRDIDVVYRALSTFQAQGTVLPRLGLIELDGSDPRDYVLISDMAIHNLKQAIPEYGKVLRADPRSRALLYYLGGGGQPGGGHPAEMDPAEALELIQRTGFKAEQVDRPWAGG